MVNATRRVLKKGEAQAPCPSCEDPLSAVERAKEILSAAEGEAAEVRRLAQADAARLRLEAEADGYADGMARAAAALARTAEARSARLAELEGEVVETALEIARQIVGRELLGSTDAVVASARRALRAAAGAGDILVRVAPGDLSTLRDAGPSLKGLIEGGALAIAEDGGLARGEVIVESAGGRVDARVAAQLDAFRRALQAEEG